jgi:hypothetical protein
VTMADDVHRSPQPPSAHSSRERLDRAQQTRERLDKMLRAYWASLVAESEPLAEAILERTLKEDALRGALFV